MTSVDVAMNLNFLEFNASAGLKVLISFKV